MATSTTFSVPTSSGTMPYLGTFADRLPEGGGEEPGEVRLLLDARIW